MEAKKIHIKRRTSANEHLIAWINCILMVISKINSLIIKTFKILSFLFSLLYLHRIFVKSLGFNLTPNKTAYFCLLLTPISLISTYNQQHNYFLILPELSALLELYQCFPISTEWKSPQLMSTKFFSLKAPVTELPAFIKTPTKNFSVFGFCEIMTRK
jgi:hypothetical protein